MVVNNIIDTITQLGFSEYEAKAYVSALKIQPATAYELARDSGIPSSKIYETIAKLQEKSILQQIAERNKKKYIPIKPEEFLQNQKTLFERNYNMLESNFPLLDKTPEISFIWNLNEYNFLIEKSLNIIKQAKKTILISSWKEEFAHLVSILRTTTKKGIKLAIIHFGKAEQRVGMLFEHPIADTIYAEKGGRGFVLVADATTALVGTVLENGGIEGAWSNNQGFITLAEDYIKHDIYIMKIVYRFDRELISTFGPNYKHLRDIFSDKEVSSHL